MFSIDLNADLGEHPDSNLDEMIMPFISSCNIACGGHIGDETSVRQTLILAKRFNVAVGAHPSYSDKENFGRKILDIQPGKLAEDVKEQISLVSRICQEEGVTLHHIKPHGALYNHAASNRFVSELILEVLKDTVPGIYWMGFASSESEKIAKENNYPFITEGFADRKYESDGSLRLRTLEGAVLNPRQVLDQVEEIVINHRVHAEEWIDLSIQSLCLHGDTKGAVTLSKEINQHLVTKGVQITAVQ
ncbi:5-oxoprolinase subunit PxpA [Ekhidna sp.]